MGESRKTDDEKGGGINRVASEITYKHPPHSDILARINVGPFKPLPDNGVGPVLNPSLGKLNIGITRDALIVQPRTYDPNRKVITLEDSRLYGRHNSAGRNRGHTDEQVTFVYAEGADGDAKFLVFYSNKEPNTAGNYRVMVDKFSIDQQTTETIHQWSGVLTKADLEWLKDAETRDAITNAHSEEGQWEGYHKP